MMLCIGLSETIVTNIDLITKNQSKIVTRVDLIKTLIGFAIEHSITEVGGNNFAKKVSQTLAKKYHCTFEDCFENPQNLAVIKELDDSVFQEIIKLILDLLDEFSYNESILKFLREIKKI